MTLFSRFHLFLCQQIAKSFVDCLRVQPNCINGGHETNQHQLVVVVNILVHNSLVKLSNNVYFKQTKNFMPMLFNSDIACLLITPYNILFLSTARV